MFKIGLTGGIACGKSTVAKIIDGFGVPVLDADQVARDVVTVGSEGLAEIRQYFGEDICLENGKINRPKLRDIIIGDSDKRTTLESITSKDFHEHARMATNTTTTWTPRYAG